MQFVKCYNGKHVKYGIVLKTEKRAKYNNKKLNPLFTILLLKDRNGNAFRKRIIIILDSYWVKYIPAFDISEVNKDWLIIN